MIETIYTTTTPTVSSAPQTTPVVWEHVSLHATSFVVTQWDNKASNSLDLEMKEEKTHYKDILHAYCLLLGE